MSRYGERNSSSNILRLKVDIHQIFDHKPRFAIVPKENKLVAHVFHAPEQTEEAVHLYHNVPLQFLEGVKGEFLLARMAWTVFPYLEIFLSSGRRRKLSRVGSDELRVEEEVDGDKCHQIYMQTRSRSLSPLIQPMGQYNQDMLGDNEVRDDEETTTDDDEAWSRGRKKRRPSYGSYPSSCASGRTEYSRYGLRID